MIPKECKRLAEVDFPIAVVSKHSAREKSIRHGHPSTLHLWWARRPLAACRAMLMALLLPDPCDAKCPNDFKNSARDTLLAMKGRPQKWDKTIKNDTGLRSILLEFIGDLSNWNNSTDPHYLDTARILVLAAHPEESPLVIDPFAGGGSIPLEALRLGCEVFASDLNPIPVLLCRVMLEDVPRFGSKLIDELKEAAECLKMRLKTEMADLYSASSPEEEPTAYIWARTVNCESPNCGAEIPLLRSLWLSRSRGFTTALEIKVVPTRNARPKIIINVYSPKEGDKVGAGTIIGGRAVCPSCSATLARPSIEAQLKSKRGGTDSAMLVAVMVATERGRMFRPPLASDISALNRVKEKDIILRNQIFDDGTNVYPNENINPIRPSPNARGLSAVTRYGMETFSDCYLPRQRLVLSEFVKFMRKYDANLSGIEGAVGRCLLIILGRCVDRWSSCCRLDSTRDTVTGSFSKQALQMVWDFCEANPFSQWSGGYKNAVEWVIKALEFVRISLPRIGVVQLSDARSLSLPDQCARIWFTDPPYYDSVPYSDLADFFYCWLRRANPRDNSFRDTFDYSNPLTPKVQECVWNQSYTSNGKVKDAAFFEHCVSDAFGEAKRVLDPQGIGCVVFAHKSTDGWEALLNGMIRAGLCITSSWPIQTEMKSRTAARDAASLMGSVHLVCRPRPDDAPVGDWGEVLGELPKRVGDWIERLQGEGIRGADLVFACIGPALEVYSRYSKVEMADGREVKLAEYLEKVWEVVGRAALEQVLGTAEAQARNGVAGVLEEDARLTALFLWTLQSTNGQNGSIVESGQESDEDSEDEDENDSTMKGKVKGYSLAFDVVRRFAQPLGIELPKWEGRIIETKKGVVRLMAISERARQLFGEAGAAAAADLIEDNPSKNLQQVLFPEMEVNRVPRIRGSGRGRHRVTIDPSAVEGDAMREATTLDRVHAAMLLQAGGQANALRALIKAEQDRGPDFLRLANALSALYQVGSEEKRLLDAMLLAVPR